MSLGWGLRGQFGGPTGAMAPGALVALALVLISRQRRSAGQVWAVAAAGALGFAIGGEETYMETVGRIANGVTVPWAYIGLLLKGGLWGGIGGLFIGSALGRRRYATTQLLLAFNVALAISFLGYWRVNEPKLIYFSGDLLHPQNGRMETWAGLWLLYLALLAFAAAAKDRTAVRLSLAGALGCGGGFVLGVLAFAAGSSRFGAATQGWMDWWKVAECGFGLIGGLTLGWAWTVGHQEPPLDVPAPPIPAPGVVIELALDLMLLLFLASALGHLNGWVGRVPYVFIVPALALLANRFPALQLLLGAVLPATVMFWNTQAYWVREKHLGLGVSLAGLAALTALTALLARQWARRPRALFLLIAWSGVACAWMKMAIPAPGSWATYFVVQGVFTAMAAWLTFAVHES